MNKPPLGIIPEKLWKEERLLELHLAIIRATHLYVENRISPLSMTGVLSSVRLQRN